MPISFADFIVVRNSSDVGGGNFTVVQIGSGVRDPHLIGGVMRRYVVHGEYRLPGAPPLIKSSSDHLVHDERTYIAKDRSEAIAMARRDGLYRTPQVRLEEN